METGGVLINIQSDMCVYTEYGDGRSSNYNTVRYVCISEYGDVRIGN